MQNNLRMTFGEETTSGTTPKAKFARPTVMEPKMRVGIRPKHEASGPEAKAAMMLHNEYDAITRATPDWLIPKSGAMTGKKGVTTAAPKLQLMS